MTRERIPELLSEVDPATVVALVNAIYLKASWQTQFSEESTSDEPFTLTSSSTVNVPTMHDSSLNTSASVGDGYRAVKLPYDGNELSMVVVVPDEGTSLADFESGLSGARLGEILVRMKALTFAADGSGKVTEGEIPAALAERAKAANVTAVVFDRGGYLYHGKLKALADAAREAGLSF